MNQEVSISGNRVVDTGNGAALTLDDIFHSEGEIIKLVIFHDTEEKEVTIELCRLI